MQTREVPFTNYIPDWYSTSLFPLSQDCHCHHRRHNQSHHAQKKPPLSIQRDVPTICNIPFPRLLLLLYIKALVHQQSHFANHLPITYATTLNNSDHLDPLPSPTPQLTSLNLKHPPADPSPINQL